MTERITNQSKPLFQMDIMDAIYNDCLCHVCKNADFEDWTWIDFITERPRHSYEILKTLRDDSLEMEGNEAFPPNLRCPPEDWNCLIQAFTEKRKIKLHGRTIPAFTSVYNRKFLILVHLSIIQQQLREQMTQETVDRYIPKRAKQIIRSVNDTPGATEREECKYDLSWYEFVEKVHALTIKARRMTEKAKQGSGKEGNKEVNEEDKEEDTKAGKEKYNGTAWMDYIFANPEIAISNFRQHNGGDPSRFPRLLCSNKDFEIFLKAFDKLGKNDHVDYDEEDGHTLSCQYQCLFAMHFMLCVSECILNENLSTGMPEKEAIDLKDHRTMIIKRTIRNNIKADIRIAEVEIDKRWAEFLGYIREYKKEAMIAEKIKNLELDTESSGEMTKEGVEQKLSNSDYKKKRREGKRKAE